MRTEFNESFYVLFSHSVQFQGFVGIGIKELSLSELKFFCQMNPTNITLDNLNTQNKINFSSPISSRLILSGCYYADPLTGQYSSFGMEVLETTNLSFTQCTTNHLTQFAAGFITLPNEIDFNYVFTHASFAANITIYTTVIALSILYILLFIWAFNKDKKDKKKTMIYIIPDNEYDDVYFYEILFYTGTRLNAGTDSIVIIYTNIYLYLIKIF